MAKTELLKMRLEKMLNMGIYMDCLMNCFDMESQIKP